MSDDMTIAEFCDLHGACRQGRKWALANCKTMDDVWATAKHSWLLYVATREGVLTEREWRLFAATFILSLNATAEASQDAWLLENTKPNFTRSAAT